MVVIEGKQKEAAATEEVVSKDAAETAKVAENANNMKMDCQRDLDKAMPALNSAIEALSQLSKGDIVEVKAMGKPPGGVVLVSKALCWCFNIKPKKVPAPDGRSKVDDYWDPAKKELWGDSKLLERLLNFDKDNIPPEVMTKLLPLETDPDFEPDAIKKASVAACGICKWVRAMIVYDQAGGIWIGIDIVVRFAVHAGKRAIDEAKFELSHLWRWLWRNFGDEGLFAELSRCSQVAQVAEEALCLLYELDLQQSGGKGTLRDEDSIFLHGGFCMLEEQTGHVNPNLLVDLGNAYGQLGHLGQQKDLLQKALEKLRHDGHTESLAISLINLGSAWGNMGDPGKQKDLVEEALALTNTGKIPEDVEAMALVNLGSLSCKSKNAYGSLGDFEQQRSVTERGLKMQEQIYGSDHWKIAPTLGSLGNLHGQLGNYETQKEFLLRSLSIMEREHGPNSRMVAVALTNLSNAHQRLGNVSEQQRLLQRARGIAETLPGHQGMLACILTNLGNAYGILGDAKQHKDLLETALALKEREYGLDHPEAQSKDPSHTHLGMVAITLMGLSCAYGTLGFAEMQRQLLDRALTIKRRRFGAKHIATAGALVAIGITMGILGGLQSEKDFITEGLAIQEDNFGSDHQDFCALPIPCVTRRFHMKFFVTFFQGGGWCRSSTGPVELAERALSIDERSLECGKPLASTNYKAEEIACKNYGKEHRETAPALLSLGDACRRLGQLSLAKSHLKQALKIQEREYGQCHRNLAKTLVSLAFTAGLRQNFGAAHGFTSRTLRCLGTANGQLGSMNLAKQQLQEALYIQTKEYGPEHKEVGLTLVALSELAQENQLDCAQRAVAILSNAYGPEHVECASALLALGEAFGEADVQRYQRFVKKALKIQEREFGAGHRLLAPAMRSFAKAFREEACLRPKKSRSKSFVTLPSAIVLRFRKFPQSCCRRREKVAKMVGPKKEALAIAEGELKGAEDKLAIKKAELQAVQDLLQRFQKQDNVAKLLAEFATAKQKKDDLQQQFEVCTKRLITAEKLINGLGGEKSRWQASSATLGEQYNNLTGDVLISSGIIAYLGCFLAKYRNESVESWISLMQENKVPSSSTFLLRGVIGEDVVIRQWVIDKLPNDQVSIDNALILSNSRRWPLMIDPQIQANKWIRNWKGEKLLVLRLSQNNYARKLEVGISQGLPVLIENVPEVLDPLLEPLLQKAKFKAGNMIMIRLGDSTVEYNEEFRLFITTKLPNPHYSPEICVQVTLLNFMVTPDGLQDQMLGILVAKEEPEVEKKRQNLIIESAQSKAQLKEIEDKILELLSNSKGNILDDEELITTLANSKVTSTRIEERVKEQEKTQALVQETRETYVPVSVRSSAMFFVVADLCKVEPMYQYSLEWFIEIFLLAIKTAEKPERNLQRRLTALQNQFIKLLYEKVCDSLFAKDKLMLSLLLTFKSMEVDSELDQAEKSLLLVGGTTGAEVRPRPAADWLSDVSWARLSEMEDLGKGPWPGFTDTFTKNISGWKAVFDSDDPVHAPWPDKLQEKLTPLQRALVLLAVRADATIPGLQDIILAKLGADFLEPPPFNLEKVYSDSNNVTPLIFVLSSGADPMAELNRLAMKNNMFETKAAVSLGQGQGPKAEFAINEGKTGGNWVILQNCHLAVSWMPVLEKLVEELDPDTLADTFRLWLSAMPSPHFPVSVLQNGMKMTVEPPKGLKSNLLRAYLSFEEEWFESAGNTDASRKAFRKMLFGLCFFHALIQVGQSCKSYPVTLQFDPWQERCNYGPLGWNIPYQFSEPDRQICVSQLKMFLEENQTIPYAALRYTASEANYGGRVTDAHDRITISNLVTDFYCEDILKDGYKFSESGTYYAPKFQPLNGYLEYIKALPINQMPEAFGLHANANLSAAIKEGLGVLSTANSMLPKGGGGDGGGKTPDQVLTELSSKFLHDIRPPFDTEWLVAKYPTDYNESMNTVVNQEALRFNKLLIRVRASLVDIGKAVKGLVIMGPDLEDVANGILLNKQPAFWQKNSYPSLKPMSSYVADLVARMNFFTDWMDNGHPANYWLSGFFFTQSFLTGQLQNFAPWADFG
eukprot:symbB.v1.2.010619.t2/scaffold696.1/size260109/12